MATKDTDALIARAAEAAQAPASAIRAFGRAAEKAFHCFPMNYKLSLTALAVRGALHNQNNGD